MTARKDRENWNGLQQVEQIAGDECRQAVGQGMDRIIRVHGTNDLVSDEEFKRRALALAWIAAPEAFGGRSLRQVLDQK